MPVVSPKQFRFMEAAKSGSLKGMAGPSPEVAEDFLSKTPEKVKSNFAKAPRTKKFSLALRKKKV